MRIRLVPTIGGIMALIFAIFLIQLSVSQPLLFLTGKVVSRSSGQPLSSISVELFKEKNRVSRSLTGDDGKYYISGFAKGSYDVVVVKHGEELFRKTVRLTESLRLDIDL